MEDIYICLYNPNLRGRFIKVIKVSNDCTTEKQIIEAAAIWSWEVTIGPYDPDEIEYSDLFSEDNSITGATRPGLKYFQVKDRTGKLLEGERSYWFAKRIREELQEEALHKCNQNRTKNGINNDAGTLINN